MPKRVHLPDGRIVNFPDSMQPAEIQAAMVKLAGGNVPVQATPPPAAATRGMLPPSTMTDAPPMSLTDEVAQDVAAEAAWGKGLVGGLKASIPFAGYQQPNEPGAVTGRVIGEGAQALVGGALMKAGLKAALPSTARAGVKFQQVMSKAKKAPVNISDPGKVALEVAEKGARGGTTPRAVTQFLRRITDPEKGPLTYEEARDWASNISRLSADEYSRLTPVMKREMIRLRVALNQAVGKAAASVGEGQTYQSAMKEFSRAAGLRDVADDTWTAAKRWALPGGLVYYGLNRMSDLVGD